MKRNSSLLLVIVTVLMIAICAMGDLSCTQPDPARGSERLVAESGSGDQPRILAGRVIDKTTGEVVREFRLKLVREDRRSWGRDREIVFHETIRNEEGRFEVSAPGDAKIDLHVFAAGYRSRNCLDLYHGWYSSNLSEILVKLEPGMTLRGRVVDEATGRPVAGAIVGLTLSDPRDFRNPWKPWQPLLNFFDGTCCAKTDGSGKFSLRGLPLDRERIDGKGSLAAAVHPDFAEGHAEPIADPGEEMIISMKRGVRVTGTVLDDEGNPIGGAMVIPQGEGMHFGYPVFSSADGTYRTAPILPGEIYVHAAPPPGESADHFGFTREVKPVTLIDSDVEVDFGPSDDRVTWRGTLRDFDGSPAAGTEVGVGWLRPTGWVERPLMDGGTSVCDGNGRFEINKLPPGRYFLSIRFPRMSCWLQQEGISLDTAGLVERDLVLPGAFIRGRIVDKSTGAPLTETICAIHAISDGRTGFTCLFAYTDDSGNFCLRGLAPGSYKMEATSRGFVKWEKEGIEVGQDQAIDDFTIVLEPYGILSLKLEGITDPDRKRFELFVDDAQDRRRKLPSYSVDEMYTIDENGSSECARSLEGGRWTATLSFGDDSYVERVFEIRPKETTELPVRAEEIGPHKGEVTLSATLAYGDRTPAEGVHLSLSYPSAAVGGGGRRVLRAVTDTNGRFRFEGVEHGAWGVRLEWKHDDERKEIEFSLPDIVIPESADDPFHVDLVLPAAEVSGRLIDARTGKAPKEVKLPRSVPEWDDDPDEKPEEDFLEKVFLQGETSRETFCGNRDECGFSIAMVPPGRYWLGVGNVSGYARYRSTTFDVAEGQKLDLGPILLEPVGVLFLGAHEPDGKPIKGRRGVRSCNICITSREAGIFGKSGNGGFHTKNGIFRFDDLPFGTWPITVMAEGYTSREVEVTIEPGKANTAQIVLESE